MIKWTLGWSLLIIGLGLGKAEANLSVYPMTVVMDKNNGATLEVSSASSETSYVKITVKRIVYAQGSPDAIEQDIQLYSDGVFAVPNRLVLPPRGKRTVRLVESANPEQMERAYRVYVESVAAPDDQKPGTPNTEPKTSLSMNVIWGVLLFDPPEKRQVSLQYAADSGLLKNTGNVFLRVLKSAVCGTDGKCHAEEWEIPTLAPGTEFNLKKLLSSRANVKEVTLTYEERSGRTTHEIKITP